MKWIGQHVWNWASRFRNDIYLEDISSGTIASGGNLGLDSNNKIVKQSDTGITDLHGAGVDGANNQLLTDDGDGTVTSESNLTFDGSTLSLTGALSVTGDAVTFTSANADDPAVIIQNTANDNQAARLQFIKNRGAAGQDSDNVAELDFYSYNDAGTPELQQYGKIAYQIDDATDGQESGSFQAWVATHDGSLRRFLLGVGGSTSNETDVTLGNGAASVTTIAGTLTMGSTAAMTNAGLLSVANQTGITGLGTISSGVWNGTAIASAYLDADTAHLSGTQTFTGTKGFTSAEGTTFLRIVQDGDQTLTPGDGAAIHVDTSDITDNNTSASGTAAMYTHVNIEAPRLLATNASVTTTDAATLYIKSAPSASTNQTITNAYALWVDAGNARFDGDIDLEGDMDINGTLETDALTIGGTALTSVCSPVAGHSSIATVGTIGTGVWQGTSIATAYTAAKVTSIVAGDGIDVSGATGDVTVTAETATDSNPGVVELATTAEAVTGTDTARAVTPAGLAARVSQIVNLKGYVTLQNNVYDYGNSFVTDDEAPFQLDDSYASGTIDSSTEVGQATLFRSAGFHVPFACTVSALQVQASCSGSGGGNVTVALVEYRPSTAGGDTSDYPRTVYEEVNVASNNNNNKIGTTTVDAGDLDATAIPAGSHLMIMVKGDSTTAGDSAVVSMSIGLSW